MSLLKQTLLQIADKLRQEPRTKDEIGDLVRTADRAVVTAVLLDAAASAATPIRESPVKKHRTNAYEIDAEDEARMPGWAGEAAGVLVDRFVQRRQARNAQKRKSRSKKEDKQ